VPGIQEAPGSALGQKMCPVYFPQSFQKVIQQHLKTGYKCFLPHPSQTTYSATYITYAVE